MKKIVIVFIYERCVYIVYELIVDCTNKCVSKCINCGTNSTVHGNHYIDLESLKSILAYSKGISARVFLGGGCFFCHPQWKSLLEFNKQIGADVIIDVPLDKYVLSSIASYPPEEYKYRISVSLWGVGKIHNVLSGTNSFAFFTDYKDLLSQNMRVSFVITKELISTTNEIINFINENSQINIFYFHRLMPTGRCFEGSLPRKDEITFFQSQLLSCVNDTTKLQFHHTLLNRKCKAFRERLHIDYRGNIYGCGWVSEETLPIANISDKISLSEVIEQAQNGEFDGKTICPLVGKSFEFTNHNI